MSKDFAETQRIVGRLQVLNEGINSALDELTLSDAQERDASALLRAAGNALHQAILMLWESAPEPEPEVTMRKPEEPFPLLP